MMILVFILLGIVILLLGLVCLLLFSTLRIQIKDLEASSQKTKTHLQYKITISMYLANKLKWFKMSFDEKQVKKIMRKVPIAKIDLQTLEKDSNLQNLKALKKLQMKFAQFALKAKIGLESPVITAFLVAFLSASISILLPKFTKKIESKKYQYHIVPIYQNKNLYEINLNCIIELKMVHIINVIYIFTKKGKSDENERTTSHRKSYGYSYE